MQAKPSITCKSCESSMKKCTKCNQEKNESEFPFNGNRLRSQCKSCVADKSRQWRLDHPGHLAQYMREYTKKNSAKIDAARKAKKQAIMDWKRERGCTVCGETEPWVLDMHHLNPKEKESNPAQSATLQTFLKEAHKCVLLCSNCHRKVHAGVMQITSKHVEQFQSTLSLDDLRKARHYLDKLIELEDNSA